MKIRAGATALVLGALGYVLLGVTRGLSIYDEAIPVVAATRILEGDRPYRDFWVAYTPGQFYLLAGLFEVFGTSLLVSRVASVVAIVGTSLLMWAMGRRLRLATPCVLLSAALWTLAVGAVAGATLSSGLTTALLLGFASATCFLGFLEESRRVFLLAGGLALGLTFVVRHDVAVCLLLAELGCAAVAGPARLRAVGTLIAATAAPVVVALGIVLALGVPMADLVEQLVTYPLTGYSAARALPLPPLVPSPAPVWAGLMSPWEYAGLLRTGLRFYFPAVVFALVLLRLAVRSSDGSDDARVPGHARPVAFVCVLGVSLLGYAWVRSDLAHIVPAWFPALLLFAWLLHQLPVAGRARALGWALALVWSIVFVWGGLAVKADALLGVARGTTGIRLDPPRGAQIVAGLEAAPMLAAIRYVREIVPPDERIFVGNAHHDQLVLNDVMFYFLADRSSGTRYHELAPGVATTAEVQTRIVQDLERRRVRCVVLRADPGYVSRPDRGAHLLDRFIQETYEPTRAFGTYAVWRRRDGTR